MKQRPSKVIIFLIPPEPIVNGGILSIFSICEVSRQFKAIHGAEVYIATYPGSKSYKRNTLFKNSETIYSFDELLENPALKSLVIHVPEYSSDKVFSDMQKHKPRLDQIPHLHINVLNQNIWLMPDPIVIAKWFSLTPKVTQTLAHKRYATQELANAYNLPTKHLSIYMDPSQYTKNSYRHKKNIIVLSPDVSKNREQIVKKLKKALSNYKIVTVRDMRYEDYKALMSSAKFAITFGEGFDNYYFEAFLSGGVAFAVYNESFFPDKDFVSFDNIFVDYEDMLEEIVKRIRKLDNEKAYASTSDASFKKVSAMYSFDRYRQNIEDFYHNKFTFVPAPQSAELLMGRILQEYNSKVTEQANVIAQLNKRVIDQEKLISEKGAAIAELDRQMLVIKSSRSWRMTRPLRKLSATVEKKR